MAHTHLDVRNHNGYLIGHERVRADEDAIAARCESIARALPRMAAMVEVLGFGVITITASEPRPSFQWMETRDGVMAFQAGDRHDLARAVAYKRDGVERNVCAVSGCITSRPTLVS